MNDSYSQASVSSLSNKEPFSKHKERMKRSKGTLSDNSSQVSNKSGAVGSQKGQPFSYQKAQRLEEGGPAGSTKNNSTLDKKDKKEPPKQWEPLDQDDWKFQGSIMQQQTPNLSIELTKRKEDLSLGQLINNTTLQIDNQTFNGVSPIEPYQAPVNQDDQSMKSGSSKKSQNSKQHVVRASDVYQEFKEIRKGLERLGEAKAWAQQKNISMISDQDQTPTNQARQSFLQQKYQKLMRTITEDEKDPPTTFLMTYQEQLKLIGQQYMLTKRREYNQLNMDTTADLKSVNQSSQSNSTIYKRESLAQLKKTGEDSDASIEYTNIDVRLLTEESRFQVFIPKSYENHYRQYFENPEGFKENQKIKEFEKKQFRLTSDLSLQQLQRQVNSFTAGLSQCQRIDVIGASVPEFNFCLMDLQQTRLALSILIDRIKQYGGVQFKQTLMADEALNQFEHMKLYHLKNSMFAAGSGSNPQLSRRASRLGASKEQQEAKRLVNEESNREIQKIKDQLGVTESKLKDVQLGRLQEKVKGFAQTERQLRTQIQEVEKKDERLLDKIEKGVCFGKVMFTNKPLGVKSVKQWVKIVQREWNQKLFNSNSNQSLEVQSDHHSQQSQEPLHKLEEVLDSCLQVEFNEIFKELTSYQVQLDYRFALLTNQQLILYKDLHMEQEHFTYNLNQLDIIDMGLVIQNNKVKKRLFFFKVVHYNAQNKTRDLYLMSVQEDQLNKWKTCLEPDQEIKNLDRSFMFVKEKVMRQRVHASKLEEMSIKSSDDGSSNRSANLKKPRDPFQDVSHMDALIMEMKEGRKEGQGSRVINDDKFLAEASMENLLKSGSRRQRGQQEFKKKPGEDSKESLNIEQLIQDEEKQLKNNKKQKKDQEKERMLREYTKAYLELQLGSVFLKYGRKGEPKHVHVFLIDKKICWKVPGSSETPRHIMVKDITEVVYERESKNFLRFKRVEEEEKQCSFSLHTKKRTLDLVALNLQAKKNFLDNLNLISRLMDQKLFKKQKFAQIDLSKILNATDLEDNEYFSDILDKINAYQNQRDRAQVNDQEEEYEEEEEDSQDEEEYEEESEEEPNSSGQEDQEDEDGETGEPTQQESTMKVDMVRLIQQSQALNAKNATVGQRIEEEEKEESLDQESEDGEAEDGEEDGDEEEGDDDEEEEQEPSSWQREDIVNDFSK